MSDTIVGISVLQPTWVEGIYRLWFDAQKDDGTKAQGWIFIRAADAQGLPDKFAGYPDNVNSIWKFKRNGTRLDCVPSVNWISWNFHNAGEWSTEYVEMTVAERAESKAGPEPTRNESASRLHYEINRCTHGEETQRLITEVKNQGVLK